MATIVQSKSATKPNTGNAWIEATFDSTPTVGNVLVALYIGAQHWDSTSSISGSGWTEQEDGYTGDPPYHSYSSYTKVAGSSEPTTIRITGSSADAGAIFLLELSGLDTSDLFEADNVAYSSSTGTSRNTGNVSPAAGAFLIAHGMCWNTTADQNFTHSASWTELFDVVDASGGGANEFNATLAYREVAAGTYSNTITWTNTSTYGGGTAYIIALNLNPATDATPTPAAVAGTVTFPTVGVDAGVAAAAFASAASFDAVALSAGAGPQPVALNAFTGFPTATTKVAQDDQAALTVIAATGTFPAPVPVAIDGEVAALTVIGFASEFSAPIVTGEFNAAAQPSTLAQALSFPAASGTGQVFAYAVLSPVAGSVSFPTTTRTTTRNANAAAAALTGSATFPFVEAAARDLTHFYNPDVGLAIEVAFDDYPLVGSPSWYNITGDVRSFTISRGRKSELDEYKAGVATVLIDANQGDYDPTSHASPYYPNVVPMRQIRIRAAYDGTTYTLFRGFVESWPMQVGGHVDETVTLKAVDGFKILQGAKDSTAQGTENSATRIGNLLDAAGWPSALRNLGAGVITVPAYTPDCGSVLALIRTITDSEAGQFYIAGNGNATFRNRTYRSGLSSLASFGDGIGEIPYQDISFAFDDSQIWNRIEVTIGGFPSYSSSTASQDKYGIRQLTVADIQLPNSSDGYDLADVYRDRYKDPKERIESIRLQPEAEPATMWPQVLGRELGQKITVTYRTNDGQTKSFGSYIEAVSHRVTIGRPWETTWSLSQYL